ncbi:hypothetical protein E4O03_04365 [Treponema sp. OMZ 792]|uniref:hypothetical protein n=1 Tax=Treponema sp. OMZ 792 TaxID=2563667 RepID=UPI0020A4B8DB|nr:hypothetical protein [Treponema sp. OMZ 792]UTC75952.1 hypothetical protein E4O03_04365 [Treponema sp. OMZ 792]
MKQKRLVSMLLVAALCTTSLFAIDLSVGGGIDFTHATKKAEIDTGWFKVSPKATGNFFGVKCFFLMHNMFWVLSVLALVVVKLLLWYLELI